jgi:hypothetical protein
VFGLYFDAPAIYEVIMARLRNTLKRLGIYTGVIVVVAEISLRVVGLGSPVLFVQSPAFGYMPAPEQDVNRFFSHIKTNEQGMRSASFSHEKAAATRRVLFVGDSVLFGTTYVDQSRIFTSLIEDYYRQNAMPVEVLNASSPGWAPANELGFIRSRGTFNADAVVFVLNTKDLTQPYAPFVPGPLTPTVKPVSAIGEAWERYLAPRIFKGIVTNDPGSVSQGAPDIEAGTPKILNALGEAKAIATKAGARFVIIFSPAVEGDMNGYYSLWDKGIERLLNWANAEHVSVIDMRAEYSKHPAAEVYSDGIHLRPLGDQLVAEEFIRRYGRGDFGQSGTP